MFYMQQLNYIFILLPDTAHSGRIRLGNVGRGAIVQGHAPRIRTAVLRRRPKVVARLAQIKVRTVYVSLHQLFLNW